ncbi:MAG: hypothetical protein Q7U78_08010, partial [Gallionella sp.]|nr:hypothetical protein [Gallionella sp.]
MGVSKLANSQYGYTRMGAKFSMVAHGRVVGMDASCWLHRYAAKHVEHSFADNVEPSALDFVELLDVWRSYGITVVVVFDGPNAYPPKAATAGKRAAGREAAKAAVATSDTTTKLKHMRKSLSVTRKLVTRVVELLRQRKVNYIFAPYEADAQLAALDREGFIEIVVTLDQDLLIHRVRNVILHLDNATGICDLYRTEILGVPLQVGEAPSALRSLLAGTTALQRQPWLHLLAAIAGCDYMHIQLVGITTATSVLKRCMSKVGMDAVFASVLTAAAEEIHSALATKGGVKLTGTSEPLSIEELVTALTHCTDAFESAPAYSMRRECVVPLRDCTPHNVPPPHHEFPAHLGLDTTIVGADSSSATFQALGSFGDAGEKVRFTRTGDEYLCAPVAGSVPDSHIWDLLAAGDGTVESIATLKLEVLSRFMHLRYLSLKSGCPKAEVVEMVTQVAMAERIIDGGACVIRGDLTEVLVANGAAPSRPDVHFTNSKVRPPHVPPCPPDSASFVGRKCTPVRVRVRMIGGSALIRAAVTSDPLSTSPSLSTQHCLSPPDSTVTSCTAQAAPRALSSSHALSVSSSTAQAAPRALSSSHALSVSSSTAQAAPR